MTAPLPRIRQIVQISPNIMSGTPVFKGTRVPVQALLDHLAVTFMEEGWSVKSLIRTLTLTRAYQLSGEHHAENYRRDPMNRLARAFAGSLARAGRLCHVEAAAVGTLLHDTGRALGRHDDHQREPQDGRPPYSCA